MSAATTNKAVTILSRVVRRVFHVPPAIPPAEWADRYAYFAEDSTPVKYRLASDPYARTILNLTQRPGVRKLVYMKAEQLGGTTRFNAFLGYVVDRRPTATLIIYPTATIAGRQNVEKIIPSIRATPCLRARLGPSTRDAKTLGIRFDRMRITMAGAPPGLKIDANVEGFSYGVVCIDELDRCHPNVVDVVDGRGKVRQNFLLWEQGTPEFEGHGIHRQFFGSDDTPSSDRGRFYLPCPLEECRAYHVREFRHVRWPGKNKAGEWSDDSRDPSADPARVKAEAWYRCPECGGKVGAEHNLWQAERHELLTVGQTIGKWSRNDTGDFVPGAIDGPASTHPIAGVHQGGLYTCFPADINPYGYVAEGFVAARGRPGQSWVNRKLGEAWKVKGETVEAKDLRTLCLPRTAGGYRMGEVPGWVLVLIATIDVQAAGHAWVCVWGLGEGGRDRCLVWFGRVRWGENTVSNELDAAVDRVFIRTDGAKMRAAAEFMDEGDRTDEVVQRARRRRAAGRISNTVKGVGLGGGAENLGPHEWRPIDKTADGRPDQRGPRRLRLNVYLWKRAAHRMMRPPGTGKTDEDELFEALGQDQESAMAGRLALPEDAPDDFVRQMVSEQLSPVKVRGSTRITYKFLPRPGHPDNHAFDCFVYFCAVVDAIPELRLLKPPTTPAPAPTPSKPLAVDEGDDSDEGRRSGGSLVNRARDRARRRRSDD